MDSENLVLMNAGASNRQQAFMAWAKTSSVCIFASPVILGIWKLIESPNSDGVGSATAQAGLLLAIVAIAAGVHLLTFMLIGIPIFLRFYSRPESAVWRWFPGLLGGTVIGIVCVPLVLSLIYGRPLSDNFMQTALAGGLYGLITAVACILNRPKIDQAGSATSP